MNDRIFKCYDVKVERAKFIEAYIVNFLSTYAATNYSDISSRGEWKTFKHPIEDAQHLAEQAWQEFIELGK